MRGATAAVREAAERAFAASDPGALGRVAGDLFALAGLLDRERRLRRALTDPAVPADSRGTLLSGVVGDRVARGATALVAEAIELQRMDDRELVDVVDSLAAQASLAEAERAGELERVEDELFWFAKVYEQGRDLRIAMIDPGVPGEAKRRVVEDLVAGKVSPRTARLLGLLLDRGHARDLDRTLEGLVGLAAERRGAVVAEVRTAVGLDANRRERLAAALAGAVGRPVELHEVLDPGVVGSLTVRVGDEVFDGSVRRQLELARERLGTA